VIRESGDSSAGQRREIHVGVPKNWHRRVWYSVTAMWRLYRTRVRTAFTVLTIPRTTAARSLPHSNATRCITTQLTAPYPVKKFPTFYGTRQFVTVFHSNITAHLEPMWQACHLSPLPLSTRYTARQ
jgi:hypothetical protein